MSEYEEKCPPMATLPFSKDKQGSRPSKPTIGHSTDDSREEDKEEVVSVDSDSEEEEKEEEE